MSTKKQITPNQKFIVTALKHIAQNKKQFRSFQLMYMVEAVDRLAKIDGLYFVTLEPPTPGAFGKTIPGNTPIEPEDDPPATSAKVDNLLESIRQRIGGDHA
jgi:hypothetical protein